MEHFEKNLISFINMSVHDMTFGPVKAINCGLILLVLCFALLLIYSISYDKIAYIISIVELIDMKSVQCNFTCHVILATINKVCKSFYFPRCCC